MAATDAEVNEAHREKMARIKAVKDRIYASKTIEKGLLIVHTGTGKGKSTAAFGLALRMIGRGKRVGIDPSLYTWKGYRTWSEQVKRNWTDDESGE